MAHPHNHDIRIECIEKSACAQCGTVVDLAGKEAFTVVECPRCQGRFTAPGKLGNLALLKVLGKGQMGVTFKAHDRSLGRSVAVKVMRAAAGADHKAIDDFFSEARALGVLDHPNVAKIYTLVEDADCPYIVMELLEGGSMEKQFDKNRPMEEVRALEIGTGVAKALGAAHEVGLIHGDVKPGNIMLDEKGRAKLVDFGIARFGGGRTNELDALGTPYYASPEQVLRAAVDFRTDIYSLGATLFHALTGVPPFPGTVLKEVLASRLKAPAPALRTVRPDLHEKTAAVVAKMLEANPKNRYASYAELRHALDEAYAEAAGLQAPLAVTPPRHASRWPLAVGGVLAAVAVAVLAVVLLQPKSETPASPEPEKSATRTAVLPPPPVAPPARPTLTPPGRSIAQDVEVAISCDTAGASIRYTLDGSDPTDASTEYRTSVQVAPGKTVKARAFLKGRLPSDVAVETYPKDEKALTDVVSQRTRAIQVWPRVKNLDPQQGFKPLLEDAEAKWTNAEELYKQGALDAAGQKYSELLAACADLDKRQASRLAAKAAKDKADGLALAMGDPKDSARLTDQRQRANDLYVAGKFDDAAALWATNYRGMQSLLQESARAAERRFNNLSEKSDVSLLKDFGGKTYAEAQAAARTAQEDMKRPDYLAALENFNQAIALLPRAHVSARIAKKIQPVRDKVAQAAKLVKDQKFTEANAAIDDILKGEPYQAEAWELRYQMNSRAAAVLPLDGNPASATAIKLVQIPAGTFEFGPPTGTRKVTITKPFFLGQYEVLHGQFDLFVKAMVAADKAYKTQAETVAVLLLNKSGGWTAKKDKTTTWVNPGFAQTPTHPVTCVTWKEAQDFCKWAGEKSHVTLRLPTDAEWEYACRAGTKTLFSFPHPNDLPEYGNFADKTMTKAGALDDHVANTAPMGTYKPNPWNLFDMHGNVLEWCEDWYQSPPPAVEKDPHGPESGTLRVIRGGSWASPPVECSSSFRRGLLPGAPSPMVGFRVVAETVPETAIVPTPVSPLPTAPPPPDVLASDLTPLRGSSHYERDLSATRAPLKVAGQDYPRGIGLAAGGTLILPVKLPDKPAFKRFVGVAGLDDTERTTKPNTALRCRVFLGDAEVAATPVLRYGALTSWPVDVAIPADADVQELRLVVEGQTPGATPDGQINWVNVGFRN